MKHNYLLLLFISSIGFAQIPSNYYDSANGLSGYTLKTQLKNIISNGHIDQGYGSLYNGYITTHSDNVTESGYENDNTILLYYTENPNGTDPYLYNHGSNRCGNYSMEGDCHNREHLIPQSSFQSASPMQADIHHVIPSDGFVNGQRGSLPFGTVGSANWTSQNGSKRGSSNVTGYSGLAFEPIDEFKGDIARAILYFVTRYEDNIESFDFVMFNSTQNQALEPWAVDMLLDWHNNIDPVDQREIDRNDAAYNYQGNANPYVNHPEYVDMIWNPSPDTESPTNPTNLIASNPTDNSIDLNWTASTDNVAVDSYDIYINSVFSFNTGNSGTTTTVTGLNADTNYCFTLKAKDTSGNESGFSNQDCETTTNDGSSGGDVDLFFSEYIEGSSLNKILEIANYTGSSIDLSIYTLKLSTNGSASWGSAYTFPSSTAIANEDVFVIAHGSAVVCASEYDDLNNSITSFNGNDALGLFKNDVLIDIIGDFNSSNTYAENTTLVRKPNISMPTTVFNINDWNILPSNDCNDLGMHNQTLSIGESSIKNILIYPNPVKSELNIDLNSNLETKIEIYDILGKRILNQLINSSSVINVQDIRTGIYVVKISQGNSTISKRLIKK